MRQFLASNTSWLYRYFMRNKSLLEIFSFLIVAESFIYSANPQELGAQNLEAFKIILWILVFLVILLLQISTVVELQKEGAKIIGTIFEGANFMKTILRLLTFVLLLASVSIFVQEIQLSLHNLLFSIFYGSLALLAIFEVIAFVVARVLPKNITIKD